MMRSCGACFVLAILKVQEKDNDERKCEGEEELAAIEVGGDKDARTRRVMMKRLERPSKTVRRVLGAEAGENTQPFVFAHPKSTSRLTSGSPAMAR